MTATDNSIAVDRRGARMTDEKEKRLGEFSEYNGFLKILRARANSLEIAVSGDETNAVAGLPDKYLQKILSIQQTRRVGMSSLGGVLGILGMKLVAFEDPIALRRFTSRLHKRDPKLVRGGTWEFRLTHRHMRKIQREGGKARMKGLTKPERRELSLHANKIRWHGKKAKPRRSAKRSRQAAGNRGAHP